MSTSTKSRRDIAIIGGGAAGFFAALSAAEANPEARITIYERGAQFLTKVRISGGGRCNVTHHCFDPKTLSERYPRGPRELRAAFHRWQPQDTINWFAQRHVPLKVEDDGRMFPTTDDSRTIIDCFFEEARRCKVVLRKELGVSELRVGEDSRFDLSMSNGERLRADAVCLAFGSPKGSPLLQSLVALGHSIEPPAPSLFAFNASDQRIAGLAGLSVPDASVTILPKSKPQSGPLLITHRGFSGPAILRTSAWEARRLQELKYHFDININWLGDATENQLREQLAELRRNAGKKTVRNTPIVHLPRRLWEKLIQAAGVGEETLWAHLPKKAESALIEQCLRSHFSIRGKTTNKDEFVTCGGLKRSEIDFRRMESKVVPNLHFAGECIDIDGITGGFNFQAAWTTGYIAGQAMAGV